MDPEQQKARLDAVNARFLNFHVVLALLLVAFFAKKYYEGEDILAAITSTEPVEPPSSLGGLPEDDRVAPDDGPAPPAPSGPPGPSAGSDDSPA